MTKEERDSWQKKYGHLIGQYYPDHFCNCLCHGKIKVQGYHKYHGVPKYLPYHVCRMENNMKKISSETRYCECNCGNTFECKVNSIQRFIRGHYMNSAEGKQRSKEALIGISYEDRFGIEGAKKVKKKQKDSHNLWWAQPDSHERYCKAHNTPQFRRLIKEAKKKFYADPEKYKLWWTSVGNPITIERHKATKGYIVPGPDWWLKFTDFVTKACQLYDIEYSEADQQIKKFIENTRYSQRDIVVFINLMVGHNQWEIAERYYISTDNISKLILRMMMDFPGVIQTGPSLSGHTIREFEWALLGLFETIKVF